MLKVNGNQIDSKTIVQNNFNIDTESIISNNNITNKSYVDTTINQNLKIYYSRLNMNMSASITTGIGQKACDISVIEFPISNIIVKLNGILIDVGEGMECYFSGDGGVTKRVGGEAQKGDYLYWNTTRYNLDTTDGIDFIYLTRYYYVTLNSGTTVELNPANDSIVVKYVGDTGTTMNVIIDGVTIVVGNVSGYFVWDIGGDNHQFTTPGETYVDMINGNYYTIWFDGFGSLIYSIKKGGS